MADPAFEDPRLAELYDPLDPDRNDLDVYAAMVDEFAATRVLDIGCGTGTLACMLAQRGIEVTGIDPAAASLHIARSKLGAERVSWIHSNASALPPLTVDIALMTGNVAQVFLEDSDWDAALRAVHAALRPGGRLVFESRDPSQRAWEEWTRERTLSRDFVHGVGAVTSWCDLLDVGNALVTFRSSYEFEEDSVVLISESTLRFRSRDELSGSLLAAGFRVDEVRDAPDRPGKEFVFVARRPPSTDRRTTTG